MNMLDQQVVQAELNHASQLRRFHKSKGLHLLKLKAFGWSDLVGDS